MDFLASLRLMLATTDLERMNLGVLAQQFITDEAIPRLQKKLDHATTDNDKDRLASLIAEYEKYADPRTQESRLFSKTAANIVRQLATRSRLGEDEMENLMQDVAVDFFRPLKEGGNDLRSNLSKFKEEGGPVALNKYWASIIDMRMRWRIRINKKNYQEQTLERKENDEGQELDPMSQIEAPSHVDERQIASVIRDLPKYIHSKVKNPKFAAMFDIWFDLAQKKGANMVDMKHDVYPVLRDQGYIGNDSSMSEQWIGTKQLIVDFFKNELGMNYVPVVKKLLHLSVAEGLTYKMYRRHLAAWMLGGILRGMVEAEAA